MARVLDSTSGSKRSLHAQVAYKVARSILSGETKEGSILPGEMILCEQFGVSRTALREAIKLLTSKGLLESRPKAGTRVLTRDNWNFLDPQLIEWMEGLVNIESFCQSFLDLQKVVEPEACALAAVYASAKQRIQLSEVFQSMVMISQAPEFNHSHWIKAATNFHRLIFSSTGNDFYLPFGNLTATIFNHFIAHSPKQCTICIDEYREIYNAIMAGNANRARISTTNYLQKLKYHVNSSSIATP